MPPLINFVNPLALGLAALLIPVIILYLLKPRPKQVKFPSIMFILNIDKSKKLSSFFRKFIRDPLLLVQLFILLGLVLSLASPYFLSSQVRTPRAKVVFIFDGSASMQAKDVYPSRFEKAKELAQVILRDLHPESKISIIFAGKIPLLLLKESADRDLAEKIVGSLRASDTPTNLEDAILFGNDLLASTEKGFEPKIYLFSDFSQVGDVKLGKGISLHQGVGVEFLKVNGKGKNRGIISINGKRFLDERDKFYLTWVVKNFNSVEEKVTVDILLDREPVTSLKKDIPANSSALFYWQGECSFQEHELMVKIREEDDFELDNSAYWILPEIRKYRLLLITNQDSYLKYALDSNPDFFLQVAKPPVIPKVEKKFDAVILGNFDADLILPGTFLELRNYLEGGGNLIILASEGLYQSKGNDNLDHFLPLELEKVLSVKSVIRKALEHEILEDVTLDNIILEKYTKASLKSNESKVIATSKSYPLLVLAERGQEKIAYIGLNPEPGWSNFYLSSSMPVFWFQLVEWMNKEEYFSTENYKAGQYVFFKEEGVKLTTPSGRSFIAQEIILDEVGIYLTNVSSKKTQKISVNLESEEESNIAKSLEVKTLNDQNFNILEESALEPNFLKKYLLLLVLIFLLIETILYKRRELI